jgi:hypothetical protein
MRAWWIPLLALFTAACNNDDPGTGTGQPPETPTSLASTSLDQAIALVWSDNAYQADPANFQNYRIYSTSFDIDQDPPRCGSDWVLEGTTVAPEFLAASLTNGVPVCFSVTAVSVDGIESDRSPLRGDTPRPDARSVALSVAQTTLDGAGFRFWDDENGDGESQRSELGLLRSAGSPDIDFSVERDINDDVFLQPVRAGTGVEYYDENDPVEDLTSIDFAEDLTYRTTGILALPGFGYVFETLGPDGELRYGAVRLQHVGTTFIILDWALQTDPGNPELLVWGGGKE